MIGVSREQVLGEIVRLIREFDGREFYGPIEPATLFYADLGMVSIDAIVLAERIEERFGRKFPFRQFLAQLKEQDASDLSVGELADFLVDQLER